MMCYACVFGVAAGVGVGVDDGGDMGERMDGMGWDGWNGMGCID